VLISCRRAPAASNPDQGISQWNIRRFLGPINVPCSFGIVSATGRFDGTSCRAVPASPEEEGVWDPLMAIEHRLPVAAIVPRSNVPEVLP
jgi:hypothetical protein